MSLEYFKRLIKKKFKTEEEWNKLEFFCRKKGCLELFCDLRDKQKFEESNYLINRNNFWDKLGVSTFSDVSQYGLGSVQGAIYESQYYVLEKKYVGHFKEKPIFIFKNIEKIEGNKSFFYIRCQIIKKCISHNIKSEEIVAKFDEEKGLFILCRRK